MDCSMGWELTLLCIPHLLIFFLLWIPGSEALDPDTFFFFLLRCNFSILFKSRWGDVNKSTI